MATQSRFEIRIRNEVKSTRLSENLICTLTVKILKFLGWKQAILSILFVGDRKMRSLNQQFLAHDWTTDVIAFGQAGGPKPKRGPIVLGDLVVCIPTAKRQAKVYGNVFFYELMFYICHGILHLMGYKDKTKKDAARMDRLQKKVLKKIGIQNK